MGNAIVSTVLQVAIAFLIAGAAWLAVGRRQGFRAFTGLTAAPKRAIAIGAATGLGVAIALLLIPGMRELASGRGTVAGEAGAGVAALVLTALIKTSFTEELLFRGLIGRNLIRLWGFAAGNAVQAALFGAVHLLLFLSPDARPIFVGLLVLVTGAFGWIGGWLNERLAQGSILPGWAMHACANLAAYLTLAGGFA